MKKDLEKVLNFLKENFNDDNFIFSRTSQSTKDGAVIKYNLLGRLEYEGRQDLINIIKLLPDKLQYYLLAGELLRLNDPTKGKTLVSKQPILYPNSLLKDVILAWEFVVKNIDKILNAL